MEGHTPSVESRGLRTATRNQRSSSSRESAPSSGSAPDFIMRPIEGEFADKWPWSASASQGSDDRSSIVKDRAEPGTGPESLGACLEITRQITCYFAVSAARARFASCRPLAIAADVMGNSRLLEPAFPGCFTRGASSVRLIRQVGVLFRPRQAVPLD